nr:MAG TPA: hypothetical protein [Caudoviricetes sp.]
MAVLWRCFGVKLAVLWRNFQEKRLYYGIVE